MTVTAMTLKSAVGPGGLIIDGDWVESKDQDPDGDVRLIQLADIGDGHYINKSARFLTSAKAHELRCTMLRPGDVLISRMADPIGRACIFPGDPRPCVTVVDICVARPDGQHVTPEWLKYAINEPRFRASVLSRAVGATRPRISGKNLQAMTLNVPDLDVQNRAVDLLARAESIVRMRREAEQKANEIIPALFWDMFGDPATNPKGWDVKPLADLVSFVSGGTPSKSRIDYWQGTLPWVSPKDMKIPEILDSEDRISDQVPVQTSIKLIPPGAVLIVVRGMILVHTVPVAITRTHVTINQDMKALLVSSEVSADYLMWLLRISQNWLLTLVTTAAHGTRKIDTARLESLSIPVPPSDLQDLFVQRVNSFLNVTVSQNHASVRAANAFQSLLAGVFGGG
jgi:type I restriction enzyme S subunit